MHPTGVNTPMIMNPLVTDYVANHPEAVAAVANALPVDTVEAVDVSNAILYLASDEARYVTGVTLPVDAGLTVRCRILLAEGVCAPVPFWLGPQQLKHRPFGDSPMTLR